MSALSGPISGLPSFSFSHFKVDPYSFPPFSLRHGTVSPFFVFCWFLVAVAFHYLHARLGVLFAQPRAARAERSDAAGARQRASLGQWPGEAEALPVSRPSGAATLPAWPLCRGGVGHRGEARAPEAHAGRASGDPLGFS